MMSTAHDDLLRKHLDVFKEIGNIGAGHAASALAGLLNRRISMTVPDASVVPFDSIPNILDGPETLVTGVLIDMSGDLNGYILLILRMQDTIAMTSTALGEPLRDVNDPGFELSDMERDTILEIANILVGSFLSAISSFTGLRIIPAVPQMAVDMMGAIISISTIEYGMIGDTVLFLKTQLNDPADEINGHFFLIPDYSSYKMLVETLGLES